MVELRSVRAGLVALTAAVGVAGCAEVGEMVIGPKPTGPLTAGATVPDGVFLPADVEDPDVRVAAGVATARVSQKATLLRIFSAERLQTDVTNYRLQMQMTDRSIWEAIVARGDRDYEVLRLERIG